METFNFLFGIFNLFIVVVPRFTLSMLCGCKIMRPCYVDMLNTLRDRDEHVCIEDVALDVTAMVIYLKAVKDFCPDLVTVNEDYFTYEGRTLFEVIVNKKSKMANEENKPVIILEAGQYGGNEAVISLLIFMQQLIACQEKNEMIEKVKWVILPAVNPDGMEYAQYNNLNVWNKNLKPSLDGMSFGVDLSRNFDSAWAECPLIKSGFSTRYPGPTPFSENETMFIRDIMIKYRSVAKAYVSLRRNGHSILYPYAHKNVVLDNAPLIRKFSNEIAERVNQRTGVIQEFMSQSIISMNGAPRCGSSVDYAFDLGIPFAFEMRVKMKAETTIMKMFQAMPKSYSDAIQAGYTNGLKKLFELIEHYYRTGNKRLDG